MLEGFELPKLDCGCVTPKLDCWFEDPSAIGIGDCDVWEWIWDECDGGDGVGLEALFNRLLG
jgi:hypothetical protein